MAEEENRENRTDLPHDQVANDNDGEQKNRTENTPFDGEFDYETELQEDALGTVEEQPVGNVNREEMAEEIDEDREVSRLAPPPEHRGYATDDRPDLDMDYREETAAEVSPAEGDMEHGGVDEQVGNVEEMEQEEGGGTALGWTALVLSVLSLFFLPGLMATAGVVVGFFAYRGGARSLGLWAIGVGIFSLLMGLFFIPFVVQ